LARRANIPIRETTSDARRDIVERLNYAHQVAVDYYNRMLFERKYSVVAEDYLQQKRNISLASIEQFKLGFAGEAWDGLLKHAATKDIKPDELAQAGLVSKSDKDGKYYDRFRQRLMIPIFNLSGKPIAFGGRTMKKGEYAKYVNSPETPLYSKSNVLYGLNFARDHIRDEKSVIVVEGYFDVISLWQAGIKNVVASSGTAFSLQQARLLARFAEEVYLFFDADSAGRKAALRSVDVLFDAGLEVKVIAAPKGEDPDSIAREHGADRIEELRENAVRFLEYLLYDIDPDAASSVAKERLVREFAQIATKISDPTRRELFILEASATLRIPPEKVIAPAVGTLPVAEETTDLPPSRETAFLSLLLNNPGNIDDVFAAVSPEDLDSRKLARLYSAMITQYKIDGTLNAARLMESMEDEEARSELSRIAAMEWDTDSIDNELRAHLREFVSRKQQQIRLGLLNELTRAEAEGDQQRADELLRELKQHGL
ncbi:MAG: DNA primase, partial [Candidatus Zixiibacteriota bacterium]